MSSDVAYANRYELNRDDGGRDRIPDPIRSRLPAAMCLRSHRSRLDLTQAYRAASDVAGTTVTAVWGLLTDVERASLSTTPSSVRAMADPVSRARWRLSPGLRISSTAPHYGGTSRFLVAASAVFALWGCSPAENGEPGDDEPSPVASLTMAEHCTEAVMAGLNEAGQAHTDLLDRFHVLHGRSSPENRVYEGVIFDFLPEVDRVGGARAIAQMQGSVAEACTAEAGTGPYIVPPPPNPPLNACEQVAFEALWQSLTEGGDPLDEIYRVYGYESPEFAATNAAYGSDLVINTILEGGFVEGMRVARPIVAPLCGVVLEDADNAVPEAGERDAGQRTDALLAEATAGATLVQLDALCDGFDDDAEAEVSRLKESLVGTHGGPIDEVTINRWLDETCRAITRVP